MIRTIEDLQKIKLREKGRAILIAFGTCGISVGAEEVYEEFEKQIKRQKIKIELVKVGCLGFCKVEPTVLIGKVLYTKVQPKDVKEILESLKNGKIVKRLLYKNIENYEEIPFFKNQKRIVLRNCGLINPENIEEYIAKGGYFALYKALNMKPEEIIEEVRKSKIRGRGGAGFPTARKWESCFKQKSTKKYVIANGEEGDPGAFMDRGLAEGDPHSILEGMSICGKAIGSDEGYVYIRAEYLLAVKRMKKAISDFEKYFGEEIFGKFNFKIKVNEGAGAYVCGESTAMQYAIEGKRSMPRARPPQSVEKGLFGEPTCLNNVETFANIPFIINNGGENFAKIGTENSTGTKIFGLSGKIKNVGFIEVPMGTKLREIIYKIGDGVIGKEFKAAHTAGPGGSTIPKELLDISMDYDSLSKEGCFLGTGSLVVMDENNCVVDFAKYFIDFARRESCGKCTPCREGTTRMYEIVERITEGEGKEEDLELIKELGETMYECSLCGLGESAPNPTLTTLKYFREEYEEHIKKKCKAGICFEGK